jgi:hypothetical protein
VKTIDLDSSGGLLRHVGQIIWELNVKADGTCTKNGLLNSKTRCERNRWRGEEMEGLETQQIVDE